MLVYLLVFTCLLTCLLTCFYLLFIYCLLTWMIDWLIDWLITKRTPTNHYPIDRTFRQVSYFGITNNFLKYFLGKNIRLDFRLFLQNFVRTGLRQPQCDISTGGHCWDYYLGTLSSSSKHCNSFNSLAPVRSECHSKNIIFHLVLLIDIFRCPHGNALRWMPQDLTDDKSTLVQVMVWCRQATSHYLNQCWLSSLSPHGVARPQWVNYRVPVDLQMSYNNFILKRGRQWSSPSTIDSRYFAVEYNTTLNTIRKEES